ncbi:LysR family transcriptional regulator (plasmid) [Burkholderia sp. FERM BP-3421]|uniref:LysR family transcriptional regulator n=1 Tax=Burkholderia sp. FERM BP-3421 TaxID=1494466 RepID=UPI002362D08C|nr:LysR family transcriptional regulator [Burkholderia sp. FERM BP-3421]WDD90237.1 LysR family transcriptional regulator [Burkholderia sp. FERM BP-3421]
MTISDRLIVDRMDWNLLRTYRVIVQEQSVSRAALRLNLTQSAISAALRRLEDTVGHTLVHRQGGQFNPTETGRKIFDISNHLYDNISQVDAASTTDASVGDAVTGTIRLLCVGQFDYPPYDDFLSDFRQSYPHATIIVEITSPEQIASAVTQKLATCGITYGETMHDGLDQLQLMRERYSLYCGRRHTLFGRTGLTPADIQYADLAALSSPSNYNRLRTFDLLRKQFGLDGKVIARSESIDEIKRLVIAGYGIACLPDHHTSTEIHSGRLWELSIDAEQPDLAVHLIWNNKKRMNSAEKAFIESLKHRIQNRIHPTHQMGAEASGHHQES